YLIILFPIGQELLAQNYYSQFYSSPLLFNPANTGRFNQAYRLGGSSRSEKNGYSQIFSQSSFFFDSKILKSLINENDRLAIGISAFHEQSISENLKNNFLSLSLAFQKGLN